MILIAPLNALSQHSLIVLKEIRISTASPIIPDTSVSPEATQNLLKTMDRVIKYLNRQTHRPAPNRMTPPLSQKEALDYQPTISENIRLL
jgi:hypothetical protein